MKQILVTLSLTSLSLIACNFTQVQAAESLNNQLKKCAAMKSDLQRLACFDRLAGIAQSAPNEALSKTSQQALANEQAEQAEQPQPESTNPTSSFGFEKRKGQPVTESQFGLKEQLNDGVLTSYIPGEFKGWSKGDELTLANGQVWKVVDDQNRLVHRATNPKVTISKGFFDSYRLGIEGINKTARVVRVK
jgi:hypothetical protein